jgi:uncharacterized protein (DUF924 family)
MLPDRARAVLDFWFAAEGATLPPDGRPEWFRKDDAFDDAIRTRFGALIAEALAGGLGDWCATPRGALARVVVLDQFTRNVFRGTPQAFAGDARALATAKDAIARGFDAALCAHERRFLYMPFEHSESRDDQERSVALFEALARETGFDDPVDWAVRHADVIRRFGRFPHRNAILGRPSTDEELAYLAQPGSGF